MSLRRSLIIWPMAKMILTGSPSCTASMHLIARMMTGIFLSLLFWTLHGDLAGWAVKVTTISLMLFCSRVYTQLFWIL
jgi:hypothetical protein